ASLVMVLAVVAQAQPDRPTSLPTDQVVPRSTLDQIYRAELGKIYAPADAEKYYQANVLIERYFSSPDQRKNVVAELNSLGLDANIVDRLTRVRMNWPEVAGGVYYINERLGPHDVRYFLGIPKTYDRANPWPLVIKLPTADAFVTDPRPDPVQVTEIY